MSLGLGERGHRERGHRGTSRPLCRPAIVPWPLHTLRQHSAGGLGGGPVRSTPSRDAPAAFSSALALAFPQLRIIKHGVLRPVQGVFERFG